MSFSEVFIRRPIMTTLLTVVVCIFGIAAYFMMPVSDLPVVDYPVITVNVAYPGASPETMASAVANPLENQFTQIQGLTSIISNNTEGSSSIILTFDLNRSVDLAAPDVQAAISRALGNLPTDLPAPPSYQKADPSASPIVYLMLTSDTLTPGQLYDFGNRTVGQRLSMIDGVSMVTVWGAKTAMRVQVHPNKLASYKIGINEVANALNKGTVLIPGGSLDGSAFTFSIQPNGQLFSAEDYGNLIVTYRNNAPVRLRDIATCITSIDNDNISVTYGSKTEPIHRDTVIVAVARAAGTNTVLVAQKIRDTVGQLKSAIPGSIKLEIFYDKSLTIVDSINDVKTTILIALILVVLIMFLFLGNIKDTIIPSITLPLSIIATFIVMFSMKFSLDNLSLMGLVLAVGFVVDDAIVVLENTVRLVESGQKPFEAAINSAKQITFTIISMTLSLAVIFVPLVFMGGVVGRIFREFSITVVLAIICSGIISLTLTPMMCARMLSGKKEKTKQNKLALLTNNILDKTIKKYGELLTWTLRHRLISLLGWIACLAGTFIFFVILPKTFLPEGDSGTIMGQIVGPLGISSDRMQKFQDKINNILITDPDIDRIITATGRSPGADQSSGVFFTKLKERSHRPPIQKVLARLRGKFAALPDGYIYALALPVLRISTGGESTAAGSKYAYVLTGPDQDELYETAFKAQKAISGLPGVADVQNSVKLSLPQLDVDIKRDRASTFGITASDVEFALGLAYAGGKVTTYKTDIDLYNVIVELDKEYQRNPEDLSSIYVRSMTTGNLAPLGSLAKWTEDVGPQNVPHFNQLNAATLSFNLKADMPIGAATKNIEEATRTLLPPGVTGSLKGEAAEFKSSMASLGVLIIIAIILKYIILGVLYESYAHPFTILTTLPVATVGGLLTLWLFGSQLSLYAYVGLFMLLGIVAKNGIMMVDFAVENMEKNNMNAFDAIQNASVVRFRPILMTGLAAIFGALPIALGFGADGASRMPLGLIVVGGLIFSQVITLFITPAIFLYMEEIQEKYLDKFELTRAASSRKGKEE